MATSSLFVCVVVLLGVSVVNAACGFGSVDLSALTRTTDFTGSDAKYTYKMNVCGMAAQADCGQAMCQYDGTTRVAGLGTYDGTQPTWSYIDATTPAKGVKAAFTNGDSCWQGTPQPRPVNVLFTCGADSQTFTVVEDPTCTFTITLSTSKACPGGSNPSTGGGLSGGSVFLIIALVSLFLYISIGCVYKRKKLGTSGTESCPNYDFWKEIPGYVKDGFRFVRHGCKRGGTYNQL